jgi:hypothetical protein
MLSLPNDGRYPVLELTPGSGGKAMDALIGQGKSVQPARAGGFEDVHGGGTHELELIGRLGQYCEPSRALLISFRPEFEAP